MSFSQEYRKSIEVAKALGHETFLLPPNNPVARGFMPKSIMVMCPTCNGAGIEKTVGGSCPRCNGDGAVKMSPKAIKRLAKKMQEQQ